MIPGTSRGIRLPDLMDEGLPIVGRVTANDPILAEHRRSDRLPAGFFQPHADYLLRVRGDSMIDAGILDGDLLAVHKTQQATNGQIVVARIEEEVTVKRFLSARANAIRYCCCPRIRPMTHRSGWQNRTP